MFFETEVSTWGTGGAWRHNTEAVWSHKEWRA